MKNVDLKEYRIVAIDESSYELMEEFLEYTMCDLFPKIDWVELWYHTRVTKKYGIDMNYRIQITREINLDSDSFYIIDGFFNSLQEICGEDHEEIFAEWYAIPVFGDSDL